MFLCSTSCFAGQYPDKAKRKVMSDFSFGLSNTQSSENIPDNAASSIWNWWIDGQGLSKPGGYSSVGSTRTLTGIYFLDVLYKSDGSKEYIISDNASVLSTKDFRIYTTLITGLNDLYDLDSAKSRFKIWMTNGFDSVFNYDGTTVTVLNGLTYNSGTTPNVPRGKYIEYNDGRFWIFNTTANSTNLHYSALNSTSGASIPPDHELAWPASNVLGVGQGDGQQGTSLNIINGRLIVSKERSIYNIESLFGNDTLYFPRKTSTNAGFVSKKSIVPLDNVLYGQEENGIHYYDSGRTKRVTDHINEDVLKFKKDITRTISDLWDTDGDFRRGQFSGTTVTANGFVTVLTSVSINVLSSGLGDTVAVSTFAENYAGVGNATSTINYIPIYSGLMTSSVTNNYAGFFSNVVVYAQSRSPTTDQSGQTKSIGFLLSLLNKRNGHTFQSTQTVSAEQINGLSVTFDIAVPSSFTMTVADLAAGSVTYKIDVSSIDYLSFQLRVSSLGAYGSSTMFLGNTTGQFIADITTISSDMTNWYLFNSQRNTNGGAVNFFYKTATAAVNIATYPYISINAGAIINSSATDNRIQWATTMTAVGINSGIPELDDVDIQHLEGTTSRTRSFGAAWKNNLWIGISTEPTGDYPVIYVKNRVTSRNPEGFTRLNIPLRSLLVDGNVFYGGAASTGIIYRMDYGNNYNGSAIPSTYETKDFSFEENGDDSFAMKDLWEYQVDVEQSQNATFTIGTSIESSAFNLNTFSIAGNGRTIRTINGVNGGGTNRTHGKQFKFRFYNAGLDETPELNAFSVIYKPTQIRN